jgi:hypothetical protein
LDRNLDIPRSGVPLLTRLCGRGITDLVVDLEYGDFIGPPSIYQLTVTGLSTQGWRVELDFRASPDGLIRFQCNDMTLTVE